MNDVCAYFQALLENYPERTVYLFSCRLYAFDITFYLANGHFLFIHFQTGENAFFDWEESRHDVTVQTDSVHDIHLDGERRENCLTLLHMLINDIHAQTYEKSIHTALFSALLERE